MYDKFCLIIEISNTFCRGAVVSELKFSAKFTIGDQEILKKNYMSKIYLYFNELSIVQMLVCITFELFHCFVAPCLRASFFITALGQIEDFFLVPLFTFYQNWYMPLLFTFTEGKKIVVLSLVSIFQMFLLNLIADMPLSTLHKRMKL